MLLIPPFYYYRECLNELHCTIVCKRDCKHFQCNQHSEDALVTGLGCEQWGMRGVKRGSECILQSEKIPQVLFGY